MFHAFGHWRISRNRQCRVWFVLYNAPTACGPAASKVSGKKMKKLIVIWLIFAALLAQTALAATSEKRALKELKADLKVIKKEFSDGSGKQLLQWFNIFKDHENNNEIELVDHDEALFVFSAQIDSLLQDVLVISYCDSVPAYTICLPDSELTTDQLNFQIAAAIALDLSGYAQGSTGELELNEMIEVVENAVIRAKAKIEEITARGDSVSIGDMFEMQMLMNNLAQLSEMSTNIVSAANSAIQSMARNVKG